MARGLIDLKCARVGKLANAPDLWVRHDIVGAVRSDGETCSGRAILDAEFREILSK